MCIWHFFASIFFCNETATTDIYTDLHTLSLLDALPIVAPDSLAGVHSYFPDPWPKKRHHKRRLIQPSFIGLLASRIKPGGYIHCATDIGRASCRERVCQYV